MTDMVTWTCQSWAVSIKESIILLIFFSFHQAEAEPAVEDEIVPQTKTSVETSYSRSYFNTDKQPLKKEEPILTQTRPVYERVVEEKPIIRVNRSKPPVEGKLLVQ